MYGEVELDADGTTVVATRTSWRNQKRASASCSARS